jgi:predicted molibdopterin-dependent oxidoreductase YjgC
VTELCPVGALTSTPYRFEARPWEIQNVPTVCGLCPVGCNVSATTREGRVKRILSRNHPEVDEGWLCDKGRFAFGHLHAADRITAPLRKAGPRRFDALDWDDALDAVEGALRAGGNSTVTALSGGETVEEAYGLAKMLRHGLDANAAVLSEEIPDGLDAFRAPLSALREAKTIAVLSETPVVERAPIVELWLKAARRAGAKITYDTPDGAVDALVTDHPETAETVHATNVYFLPLTPNGRGVADAWSAAGDGEPVDVKPRLIVISGDEAALDPGVRAMAAEAETVIGIGLFETSFRGVADLVLPGTSYLERDGTTVNLEGRLQRQRRAVFAPVPDVLAWLSKLAERFGVELSPYASVVFDEIGPRCFGGISYADIGERASLPPRAETPRPPGRGTRHEPDSVVSGLRLATYKPLFSGPAVERTPHLQFQRPEGEVQISREDARNRRIRNGQTVTVSSNGTAVELRVRIARDLAAGSVRIADVDAGDLHVEVEVKP